MDSVLLVESDTVLREKLQNDLIKLNQFEVETASDGEKAIEILRNTKMAVLVTEIDFHQGDGLELLSQVTHEFSSMPCIVVSNYGRPWFFNKNEKNQNLYYIEKPVTSASLSQAIMIALTLKDEGSSIDGFCLRSFLPLIELMGKTCRLKIESKEKGSGYLYFEKGILIDAHYKLLEPGEVVTEIIDWGKITFTFSDLPRRRIRKRLRLSTIDIVGASWRKKDLDDSGDNGKPERFLLEDSPDVGLIGGMVENIISTNISKYKTIPGYRAIGLIDAQFNPVTGHNLEKELKNKKPGPGVDSLFSLSSWGAKSNNLGSCGMIALSTSEITIQILNLSDEFGAQVYLIGLTENGGNRKFMKIEMEKLRKRLKGKYKSQ